MNTVLISGGTGLVGTHLCKKLIDKGYNVAVLSRVNKQEGGISTYAWDVEKKEIDDRAIESADYIIHLAGASIDEERWTNERKQLILDSRVQSTRLLFDSTKRKNGKLKAFISASAIGYYGAITSNKILSETDPPANDFLGETCRQWEQSADMFEELSVRTVKIRTGVVLTKQGGALSKMIAPVKMGIGSAIGSGNQYLPWIHIDDLCSIYIKAIEDTQMLGAYNAVSPQHNTNKDFIETLAYVLHKPFWFPNVPSFAMKLMFGKMSEILLQGTRISSKKIRTASYSFLFPDLKNALKDLVEEN